MIKFIKAKVVKGEKGYVPVKDQVGGATIQTLPNNKDIYVADLSVATPSEKKELEFKGHWQIFDANGNTYVSNSPSKQSWMEQSHIEIVPESGGGDIVGKYVVELTIRKVE